MRRVIQLSAAIIACGIAAGSASAEPKLRYDAPAEWSVKGWMSSALPVGNGYFGVSEFGGTDVEWLQFTEPTFQTRFLLRNKPEWPDGNMTDAADVSVAFGHTNAVGYVRELDLSDAVATVRYTADGVRYDREYFVSYPDKVCAMRFTASKPGALAFTFRAAVPYLDAKGTHARTGSVSASDGRIDLKAKSAAYGVSLAGRFRVTADGRVTTLADGSVRVEGAGEAVVIGTLCTNYRLVPEMFAPMHEDRDRSAAFGPDPSGEAARRVEAAAALGYARLKARHLADFRGLVGRSAISLDVDPADARLTTPQLRRRAEKSAYLAMLHWQLGKYLLASSSRPGTLPASLQGVWSGPMLQTPWGSGYWHNINVQMTYWPAFSCNMAETFRAYAAYNAAYRPVTRAHIRGYLEKTNPRAPDESFSDDIWALGTAAWPYELMCVPIPYQDPDGHSGPGTGGLTTALFIDWADFTNDRSVLEDVCWPVVRGMADFLSRTVAETNGLYLATFSASPEQRVWLRGPKRRRGYYHTVGCAFDQQMIELNNAALLRFAARLGRGDDPVVRRCAAQAGRYDPVVVGASGQVKEYREENAYGEIGDKSHRHISHLVGLYPGSIVNRGTPQWMQAARRTLELRGDRTHAWSLMHRMGCRARMGDGDTALAHFGKMMRENVTDTLWAELAGVQELDAVLGSTAAITELLVQSHETDAKGAFVVDLLPALPSSWMKRGSFRGLCVRGGWEIDCEWAEAKPVRVTLRPGPHAGPRPLVRFNGRPWRSR